MLSGRMESTKSEITQTTAATDTSSATDLGNIDSLLDLAYKLVWKEQEYDEAVGVLMEVLGSQISAYGKYHRETASTFSFIGTTLWFARDYHKALNYLCESKRIFHRIATTSGGNNQETATARKEPKAVTQINNRITKILERLGLNPFDIAKYHDILDSTIEHERVSNKYQRLGDKHMTRLEMHKAKKCSEELKRLVKHRLC